MTRRERILALLEGRAVDKTPATSYGVDRYGAPWRAEEPSYADVLECADQYDHIFAHVEPYYASFGNTNVLAIDDQDIVSIEVVRQTDRTIRRSTLLSPHHGQLTCESTDMDGAHTAWVTEYPMKSEADMKTFAELPFVPKPPSRKQLDNARKRLGDRGVLEIQVPTAVCIACENMRYEDFMMRTMIAKDELFALLERCQELVETWLTGALENGAGPVFRLFGGEYAVPPMLPPSFFEEAVVKLDGRLVDIIHKHGCFARYHCHGPIRHILPYIMQMGVDLLDPCEGPPNGDIALEELAEIVGDQFVVMGNIQAHDMETRTPDEIEDLVEKTLNEVNGKCRHIIQPTAPPFEVPLDKRISDNFIRFLEAAWRLG